MYNIRASKATHLGNAFAFQKRPGSSANYQPGHVRTGCHSDTGSQLEGRCCLKLYLHKNRHDCNWLLHVLTSEPVQTQHTLSYACHFQQNNTKPSKMTRNFELCCAQHPPPSTSPLHYTKIHNSLYFIITSCYEVALRRSC